MLSLCSHLLHLIKFSTARCWCQVIVFRSVICWLKTYSDFGWKRHWFLFVLYSFIGNCEFLKKYLIFDSEAMLNVRWTLARTFLATTVTTDDSDCCSKRLLCSWWKWSFLSIFVGLHFCGVRSLWLLSTSRKYSPCNWSTDYAGLLTVEVAV